jgi:prepilin-type N-terminal cleavage/methylation domain-containing protein
VLRNGKLKSVRTKIISNCLRKNGAFSLIESLVATAIVSIVCMGLYAGISSGFTVVEQSRENLRATQILLEKMETIRLYSWDQINSNSFIPPTFSAAFQPGRTNYSTNSLVYTGSVLVTNVGQTLTSWSENYSNDMRLVVVQLTWRSAGANHTRTMRTMISRYGMQNYIY